jgi:hypothetical protein
MAPTMLGLVTRQHRPPAGDGDWWVCAALFAVGGFPVSLTSFFTPHSSLLTPLESRNHSQLEGG